MDKKGTKTIICSNRRALHNYAILERLEAGLVLTGTEVKSLRAGKAHLNDAYVQIEAGQAFLLGAHIAPYDQGNRFNHEPTRKRKLLLHQREITKLDNRLQVKGFTGVPLSLYFDANGRVKLELGVGKGKRDYDRRQDIKERDLRREIDRALQSKRR